MNAPMLDMLRGQPDSIRMHMPGHKGRLPAWLLSPAFDTTELPATDDLYAPTGAIREAQRLAAASAGAASTLMLSGGSTAGILAMMLHALRPGEQVILPRNAHVAAVSACVLAGAQPVYVWPRQQDDGLLYTAQEDLLQALRAHPDAKAVLVTRPDYYGLCPEITTLARVCQEQGIRLLVDEAHGAHFPWADSGPRSAGALGAHLWVQSAHKTLPALTGAAWLHAAPGEEEAALRGALRLVMTSSPSFPILSSLDYARDWMDAQGRAALDRCREEVSAFWKALEPLPGLYNAHRDVPGETDPLRVVVDVSGRGLSGYQALEALTALGVVPEMADARRVVLIPTVFDRPGDLAEVARRMALLPYNEKLEESPFIPLSDFPRPRQALPLGHAARAVQVALPPERALGRVAAAPVGLYPPGVPLLMPGEEITAGFLAALHRALQAGATPFGLENHHLPCVAEGEFHAIPNLAF